MALSKVEAKPLHPEQDLDDASSPPSQRSLIGKFPNHWLHSASPPVFDLTRPPPPQFEVPAPENSICLSTSTTSVIISPALTALIIIDMQNFFLSTSLGRSADGAGNLAGQCLLRVGIPAARKAGIRIIWLNWGLTDEEIDDMPPSTRRAFGFDVTLNQAAKNDTASTVDSHGINQAAAEEVINDKNGTSDPKELVENGQPKRIYKGLGSEIGHVMLEDGSLVDGGRLLMRDTWNAALPPLLNAAYHEGRGLVHNPDVWIHKNRMSGLWGSGTPCTDFLEKEEIRTLLFAGVNTDQCVAGSLQDAFSKGWDCILLKNACGTTSPTFAKDCIEFNSARTWGFVSDCDSLLEGVEGMLGAK